MNGDHVIPFTDVSNLNVNSDGDTIVMTWRICSVCVPNVSEVLHVQLFPSMTPVAEVRMPALLNELNVYTFCPRGPQI